MGIITWIALGAIADFFGTMLMGNRDGMVMTVLLGIVGAIVGGFLATAILDMEDPTAINLETILLSVIGAIIAVFAANLVLGSRRDHGSV